MLFRTYRYSQWDGSQNVFELDADALMDRLADDLLKQGDVTRALRELFNRGLQDQEGRRLTGLKELMERLEEQRHQQLQQYNMDSVMDDIKHRLESIIQKEREGIDRRLQQGQQDVADTSERDKPQQESLYKLLEQRAQHNREKLDNLPESSGGKLKELMEYDFMDPQAQQMFQELLDMLKRQMAQTMSQEMKQHIQGMSPEEMAGLREMLRQLNQMMRDKMSEREPDLHGLMQQFGPMFGPNPPQSFDELIERLQQQLAQMQSMLESMSPEMRRELEEALSSVLDPETQREMAQFASLMEQMMPMERLRREYPFMGDDSLTLDQGMDLMGRLQEMDQLEQALQDAIRTGKLSEVDPDKLADLLGEDARRAWEQLDRLRQLLKDAGYVMGDDKLDLTARGIRRIGQRALREVFVHLQKDRAGNHQVDIRGGGGEQLGDTKTYEFGDPFFLDLQTSVKNAIVRTGPQVPVEMTPKDFEVYRTEHMTRAATAVLLDQSRSMGLFGNFQAARKVTVALFALIRSQYPRDRLYVIGFSDYAREIKEEDLVKVSWNSWVSGTNLHHALLLSRKLLSREKGGTRQILLITDGEPTAHLEGDRSYFSYPPSYRTETETLKEVKRCTQDDIVINTFMLENTYQLVNFVDRMTRINRGRTFYASASKLGEYVLVDYVHNRRKRVTA